MILDIERLRSLQNQESIENKKKSDSLNGAAVIMKQINERDQVKKKGFADKEIEKIETLSKIKGIAEEEI